MPRTALLLTVLLGAVHHAPAALAQSVLVLWGDSLVCGFGSDTQTGTPYGPAPFGDPVPDAWRWDAAHQDWTPMTAEQNFQGTGADPAYGAAAAWVALHRGGGPVYVIALGEPGADVSPQMTRRRGSWSPTVREGALRRFLVGHLRPALASLPAPRVEWICGSAGNNCVPSWEAFSGDLAATWAALLAEVPGRPRTLMLRSYLGSQMEARVAIGVSGHAVVDLDALPTRTGGLQPDGVHLTHYGNVCAGHLLAVAALRAPPPPVEHGADLSGSGAGGKVQSGPRGPRTGGAGAQ